MSVNKYYAAAIKARRNLGLGEVEQHRILGKQPDNLEEAVERVMGQFAEGESHMAIFIEEAENWLED